MGENTKKRQALCTGDFQGKLEILLTNPVNKNIVLKPGTQIGSFQVCKHPIKILNEGEDSDKEKFTPICSVLEDIGLERKFRNHLKPVSRPDLEQDLISMLIKHKAGVALPGDALDKTSVLKHQIRLKPRTNPIYIPAYIFPHSNLQVVDKLTDEMLSQDGIEPSNSDWNFPLILVPESDGTM